MAKILSLSDPHYHNYKPHSTLVDGVNSRLIDVDAAMESAMELGRENGVDLFTVSGDVFHERGRIRPSVFNRAYSRFRKMAEIAPVVLDIGNHDMEDFKLGASSIDTFESIGGVYVLGGTEGYSRIEIRGLKILGIQYFHKTEEFKEVYEKALSEFLDSDIILMHQGVDDFNHDIGMPDTKLTAEYLSSLTGAWIFCGHYHTPESKGKVVNVGAPLQHTFGDEGKDRGCWITDTDECLTTFHCIESPRFVTVNKKADIVKKGVGSNGSFVRVIAKTPRTAKTLEKACFDAGAKTVTVMVDKNYTTAHEKTVAISKSPTKMIGDFCDINGRFTPHKVEILKLYEKVCA
jgi:DNA repair exonuclease SbcCD nuclease subunit